MMAHAVSKNKFYDIPQEVMDTYELTGERARQAEEAFQKDLSIMPSGDTEAFGTTWSDGRRCSYKYN
jgi:hypothetical protein